VASCEVMYPRFHTVIPKAKHDDDDEDGSEDENRSPPPKSKSTKGVLSFGVKSFGLLLMFFGLHRL
jgi:hypothetical protein